MSEMMIVNQSIPESVRDDIANFLSSSGLIRDNGIGNRSPAKEAVTRVVEELGYYGYEVKKA